MINRNGNQSAGCPCGNCEPYDRCCGRYIDGSVNASTPEALMRSRYSAYILGKSDYIHETWHTDTRPEKLELRNDKTKWTGLTIISTEFATETNANGIVEFIARYKRNGKAGKLHERSRFFTKNGRWYYVNGDILG